MAVSRAVGSGMCGGEWRENWREAGGNGGAGCVRSFPKIEFQQTGLAEIPMDAVAAIFEESAPVKSPVAPDTCRAEA